MTESSHRTRIFAPFEWMVAIRYLRAKRQESFMSVISFLSLTGIALGVATLIVVMSVMGGFRTEFEKSILGFNAHVKVEGQGSLLTGYDAIAARLRAVPDVTRAAPIIDGQVMATNSAGGNTGVIVRGMRSSDLAKLASVANSLTPNALANFNSDDSVIIGAGLARKLGIRPGGSITLISPHGDVTPFGVTPQIKTYMVAGTFKIGNSLYDGNYAFMPLDQAQIFFNIGDTVTSVEVMVTRPDDDRAMLPVLARAAGPGLDLVPWQSVDSSFLDAVQMEGSVMFLILGMIVLVAALNIVSGLTMLVKDKSPDIAILRTMGATRGAVMRVFLIAGMSIGIAATLTGFLLGVLVVVNLESIRQFLQHALGVVLFDPNVYFLARIPADLDPKQVMEVMALALGLTFLATLYPSWRAARLDPVEALRYE
jgi:lipoprotein-releasing system permease protein